MCSVDKVLFRQPWMNYIYLYKHTHTGQIKTGRRKFFSALWKAIQEAERCGLNMRDVKFPPSHITRIGVLQLLRGIKRRWRPAEAHRASWIIYNQHKNPAATVGSALRWSAMAIWIWWLIMKRTRRSEKRRLGPLCIFNHWTRYGSLVKLNSGPLSYKYFGIPLPIFIGRESTPYIHTKRRGGLLAHSNGVRVEAQGIPYLPCGWNI